jgi:DNA-binding NarL/FixJ family response regulator
MSLAYLRSNGNERTAIRKVHREIVPLVARGLHNKEVAAILHYSEHMIKNMMREIYDDTGFSNRVELALWYISREHLQNWYELR